MSFKSILPTAAILGAFAVVILSVALYAGDIRDAARGPDSSSTASSMTALASGSATKDAQAISKIFSRTEPAAGAREAIKAQHVSEDSAPSPATAANGDENNEGNKSNESAATTESPTNAESTVSSKQSAAPDPNSILAPRTLGDPQAPVKFYEYASLTCPHCASFHTNVFPKIKEAYIDTGKVYFVFQDFPLNIQSLHASIVARCLPEERYFGFIKLLFETQESWAVGDYLSALRQNARLAGMSDAVFESCLASEEAQQGLIGQMQDARARWKLTSTPSVVLNDGAEILIGARGFEELEKIINGLLKQGG